MRDPYAVLGVHRNASTEEIKSSFRTLAKRLHPDLNPNDTAAEESFKVLNEAYSLLSDEASRRQYDASHRMAGLRQADARAGSRAAGAGFASASRASHARADTDPSEHIDLDTWMRMQFAADQKQRDEWNAARTREEAKRGFAGLNDDARSEGSNWETRRAARWAAASAERGASETGHYRVWAQNFRASQQANSRAWPFALAAALSLGAALYVTVNSIGRDAKGNARRRQIANDR
jgi:curved DNA-binding protein CbpA